MRVHANNRGQAKRFPRMKKKMLLLNRRKKLELPDNQKEVAISPATQAVSQRLAETLPGDQNAQRRKCRIKIL
jgi:hypothetical protein